MISSELDAAGVHDPRPAGRLPALSHAERRARADVLPGDPAARPRQRPAVHALYGFARRADDILDDFDATLTATERADRLQRLATQLFDRLTHEHGRRRRPGIDSGGPHRAHVRHRLGAVRRLPRIHADGSHRHRLPRPCRAGPLHVRIGGSDRTAAAARAGHDRARVRRPLRMPPHSEKRSSSPTSCATSMRIWSAAGSICPPTSWPHTMSIVMC